MAHVLNGVSDKIPAQLRDDFSHLSGEIMWFRQKWLNYKHLFGHSAKRVDFLNKCGGTFFHIIDHLFIDDAILTFSRLTDSPTSFKKSENFCFEQLLVKLDKQRHASLISKLEPILSDLRAKAANLREHRNKRVAHSDSITHFTEGESLPLVSRQVIEEALIEAERFLGAFDFHFSQVQMLYDVADLYNGAEILLTKLVKGQVYEDLEKNETIPRATWRQHYKDI